MRPVASLLGLATVTVAAVGVSTAAGGVHQSSRDGEVAVQIIGLNDFHGHLEPPAGKDGRIGSVVAGGAEYLATHVDRLRRSNPNSIVVSAGDLFGNSPLLSALFHDEPAGRGHERDRARPQRRRATTSSTRAWPSCSACSGAAAIRSKGARTGTGSVAPTSTSSPPTPWPSRGRGAGPPSSRPTPWSTSTASPSASSADAGGDALLDRSGRRRRVPLPRRGRHRQRSSPSSSGKASSPSSCSCTKAASQLARR